MAADEKYKKYKETKLCNPIKSIEERNKKKYNNIYKLKCITNNVLR